MSRNLLRVLVAILVVLCGTILPVAAQTPATSNFTGTIAQVSATQLTLQSSGRTVVFALTNATVIKVDGKVVGAGDLKAGMSAIVVTADGKTATEIRSYTPRTTTQPPTTPPAANGQSGTITQVGNGQLTLQASGKTLVFTLTSATVTKVDGKVVGVGDVKTGMSAIVFSTDGKTATEVRAYTPKTTTQPPATPPATNGQTGMITQIGDGQLTLKASDKSLVFTLTSATVTKVDGKVVGVGDIKTGMSAIVFSTDGKTATEVRAYTPKTTTPLPTTPPATNGQTGTITQIGDGQLTLQASDKSLVFTLTNTTVTKVDGKVVGAGDIKTGMSAIVFSTDGKTATEVRAYTPKTPTPPAAGSQTGTITQVSNDRLTLQSSIHTVSFALTSATVIHVDGKSAAISDLKTGLSAIVISTDGTTATEVRAYTPPVP